MGGQQEQEEEQQSHLDLLEAADNPQLLQEIIEGHEAGPLELRPPAPTHRSCLLVQGEQVEAKDWPLSL